jgi:hypothetical protein
MIGPLEHRHVRLAPRRSASVICMKCFLDSSTATTPAISRGRPSPYRSYRAQALASTVCRLVTPVSGHNTSTRHQGQSAACLITYKRHNAFTERNSTVTNLMLMVTFARLLILNARFARVPTAVPVSKGGHAVQKTPLRVLHDR